MWVERDTIKSSTGFRTESWTRMEALLTRPRGDWASAQPFMGHRLGTIIELSTDWGLVKSGTAMFVGIHTINIRADSSTLTNNLMGSLGGIHSQGTREELATLGKKTQLELWESLEGGMTGVTFWTQEWLQGENIIRENVPYCLYRSSYIEGSGNLVKIER